MGLTTLIRARIAANAHRAGGRGRDSRHRSSEKTDALYFVASGKPDGSHVFSATLEAHNAAVAAYLSRQRQKAVQDASR